MESVFLDRIENGIPFVWILLQHNPAEDWWTHLSRWLEHNHSHYEMIVRWTVCMRSSTITRQRGGKEQHVTTPAKDMFFRAQVILKRFHADQLVSFMRDCAFRQHSRTDIVVHAFLTAYRVFFEEDEPIHVDVPGMYRDRLKGLSDINHSDRLKQWMELCIQRWDTADRDVRFLLLWQVLAIPIGGDAKRHRVQAADGREIGPDVSLSAIKRWMRTTSMTSLLETILSECSTLHDALEFVRQTLLQFSESSTSRKRVADKEPVTPRKTKRPKISAHKPSPSNQAEAMVNVFPPMNVHAVRKMQKRRMVLNKTFFERLAAEHAPNTQTMNIKLRHDLIKVTWAMFHPNGIVCNRIKRLLRSSNSHSWNVLGKDTLEAVQFLCIQDQSSLLFLSPTCELFSYVHKNVVCLLKSMRALGLFHGTSAPWPMYSARGSDFPILAQTCEVWEVQSTNEIQDAKKGLLTPWAWWKQRAPPWAEMDGDATFRDDVVHLWCAVLFRQLFGLAYEGAQDFLINAIETGPHSSFEGAETHPVWSLHEECAFLYKPMPLPTQSTFWDVIGRPGKPYARYMKQWLRCHPCCLHTVRSFVQSWPIQSLSEFAKLPPDFLQGRHDVILQTLKSLEEKNSWVPPQALSEMARECTIAQSISTSRVMTSIPKCLWRHIRLPPGLLIKTLIQLQEVDPSQDDASVVDSFITTSFGAREPEELQRSEPTLMRSVRMRIVFVYWNPSTNDIVVESCVAGVHLMSVERLLFWGLRMEQFQNSSKDCEDTGLLFERIKAWERLGDGESDMLDIPFSVVVMRSIFMK